MNSGNIGIQNVNRRIKLYYGNEYGRVIESRRNQGTKVRLRLPAITERANRDAESSGN